MNIDNRYALLDPRLFHKQPPKPLKNPIAGHFNHALASQLGWQETAPDQWVPIIAGETLPDGFDPLAMVYAGHQLGIGQVNSVMVVDYSWLKSSIKIIHFKTYTSKVSG